LGGNVDIATQQALSLLSRLSPEALPAFIQPFRVYLTAYRALQKDEPQLAKELLVQAQELLAKWEISIPDERSRQTFRTAVPAHRALLELANQSS
jgi:hypothetical protein